MPVTGGVRPYARCAINREITAGLILRSIANRMRTDTIIWKKVSCSDCFISVFTEEKMIEDENKITNKMKNRRSIPLRKGSKKGRISAVFSDCGRNSFAAIAAGMNTEELIPFSLLMTWPLCVKPAGHMKVK